MSPAIANQVPYEKVVIKNERLREEYVFSVFVKTRISSYTNTGRKSTLSNRSCVIDHPPTPTSHLHILLSTPGIV